MLFLSQLRSRCKCPIVWCLLMCWSLAFASPLVKPPHSVMVCSSAGIQWVDIGEDGDNAGPSPHPPDCALCLPLALPMPPPADGATRADLVHHLRAIARPAPDLPHQATPPPARGPPRFPSQTREVFT